eukprot:11666671-Prorocentrum_lima.AAC.1
MWAWLVYGLHPPYRGESRTYLRAQNKGKHERCPEIKVFSVEQLKDACIQAGTPYQSSAVVVTTAQIQSRAAASTTIDVAMPDASARARPRPLAT